MDHSHEDQLSFDHEAVNEWVYILSAVAIFGGLCLLSLHNYLLFHSLAELFSVVIAFGIFLIAWNSRRFSSNNYLLFVGIAFLFVGGIDLVHTIAYKGMGVFPAGSANLPTQLWIAARYLESTALFLAPWFLGRRINPGYAFAGYALVFAILLWSIFSDIFPVCYVEGVGLTLFKIISEYVICLILGAALFFLFVHKRDFDLRVLRLLLFSIVFMIFSELAFTAYIGVYDIANMAGHLFKIASFYLIYRALIKTGFVEPYNLIFRDLKRNEESLQRVQRELEARVEERTAELRKANELLKSEIAEHRRTEEALREATEALRERGKRLTDLSARLLKAHEEERKRIAGELHDTIGACLSAIKYRVEGALQTIGETATLASESLTTIIPVIQEGVEECRRIQTDLRPSMLDDLGLLPTLSWFGRRFQTIYSGIQIKLEQGIEESEIPHALKIVVYRIAQEAMNNIAKHSKADLVRICLQKKGERMELVLQDNGQGFDLKRVLGSEGSRRGLGLNSMRERTELSGGRFAIESAAGKGTIIKASWPFHGNI